MSEDERSKMEGIIYNLKIIYYYLGSYSREQVLRTVLYLDNVNSWNISPDQELLNGLIVIRYLALPHEILRYFASIKTDRFDRNVKI